LTGKKGRSEVKAEKRRRNSETENTFSGTILGEAGASEKKTRVIRGDSLEQKEDMKDKCMGVDKLRRHEVKAGRNQGKLGL